MKRFSLLILCIIMLSAINAQSGFISANQYFDDGRKGTFSNENKRTGDLIAGLIEDNTGQYVTYKKVKVKSDGTPVTSADVIPGRGIYRKKGADFFKLNFDGPVNIRWFGAIPDGKTDNSESIQQAINASSFIQIPAGNFAISNSIVITKPVKIVGLGFQESKLVCTNTNMAAIVLGNENTTNLSLLTFEGFTIFKGKYAISASREVGKELFIERCRFNQINFEEQSSAAVHIKGKKMLFLVNTFTENVFRYCGAGIVLENVFSTNLNHIQLNRFEGTAGGIHISTTNNEINQLTISKNRFEAIVSKANFVSPIYIGGGNQNVSVADNYFEDVPEPVIHFDALNGIAIAPSFTNNQFSANIKGSTMIKLASQVKSPNIVSNVFKPGQPSVTLVFGSYVAEPAFVSNYGNISLPGYPIPYDNFTGKTKNATVEHKLIRKSISHKGSFAFEVKLPASGVFNVSVALAEDGDFSLGGVTTYKMAWIKTDASLGFVKEIASSNNPNTTLISLSKPNKDGVFMVTIQKADKKQRLATCYITLNADLDIDRANTQVN